MEEETKARYVGRDEGKGSTGGRRGKRSEGAHEEAKAEPVTDDKDRNHVRLLNRGKVCRR